VAQILDFAKKTFSLGSEMGDFGIRQDKAAGSEFPDRPGGVQVYSYTVPTGFKISLRQLSLSMYPGAARAANNNPAAVIDGGIWKIKVNNVDQWEGKIHGYPEPRNGAAGDETIVPFYSAFQLPNLGGQDGFNIVYNGNLKITVTPSAAAVAAGARYIATVGGTWYLWGPLMMRGVLIPTSTTADQVLIDYTPGGSPGEEYSIFFTTITLDAAGPLVGSGRIEIDGMPVIELPPMGMAEMNPMFNREGQPSGVLNFPLEELVLYEGQTIKVFWHSWQPTGSVVDVQLCGETAALGGAGGGGGAFAWAG
jgi:hypothetical protein